MYIYIYIERERYTYICNITRAAAKIHQRRYRAGRSSTAPTPGSASRWRRLYKFTKIYVYTYIYT